MRKPFVLPPGCGLILLVLCMHCCAFGQIDTAAPAITLAAASPAGFLTISITGRPKAPAKIRLAWQILLNGQPGPKGFFPPLYVVPDRPQRLRLPVKLPPGNEEAWLRITCSPLSEPARARYVTLLPLRPWHGDPAIPPAGELLFTDSNNIFSITAPNTLIQFDKQTGWLLRYEAGHALLMTDTAGVQAALWPAVPPRLQLFSTSTGTQLVIVRTEYTLPETASLLHLSYTINAAGQMLVGQTLEPDTSQQVPDTVRLPPLPGFGMQWLLPPGVDSLTWFGSPETNGPASAEPGHPALPDSVPGIFGATLSPATDTRENTSSAVRWLTFTDHQGSGLRITADSALITVTRSTVDDSVSHRKRLLLNIGSYPTPPVTARAYGHYSYKVTPISPAAPAASSPPSPRNRQTSRPPAKPI
jgi:Beta galactosidase small chain